MIYWVFFCLLGVLMLDSFHLLPLFLFLCYVVFFCLKRKCDRFHKLYTVQLELKSEAKRSFAAQKISKKKFLNYLQLGSSEKLELLCKVRNGANIVCGVRNMQ